MKSNAMKRTICIMLASVCVILGWNADMISATAAGESNFELNAGAALVVETNLLSNNDSLELLVEEAKKAEEEKYTLVMAKVDNSVNVRAEADENAEKVGKLYKDCGGDILERGDGWTKLQSGELIGWVKNEYLYFGEEAQTIAHEVGYTVATVNTEALRVRKEPSEDAGVYGLLEINSEQDVVEELDGWVSINYNGKTGYVAKEFVTLDFYVDEGETMEEIKEREYLAALEKAQLTTNLGAITASEEDIILLGALIQCEAGNQSSDGKLAVGAVVVNRVRSGKFPGSISEVIYSPGQFTPASNGKLETRLASGVSDSCMEAARVAVTGATNVGNAHYFRRAGNKTGVVIGAHVFW